MKTHIEKKISFTYFHFLYVLNSEIIISYFDYKVLVHWMADDETVRSLLGINLLVFHGSPEFFR